MSFKLYKLDILGKPSYYLTSSKTGKVFRFDQALRCWQETDVLHQAVSKHCTLMGNNYRHWRAY